MIAEKTARLQWLPMCSNHVQHVQDVDDFNRPDFNWIERIMYGRWLVMYYVLGMSWVCGKTSVWMWSPPKTVFSPVEALIFGVMEIRQRFNHPIEQYSPVSHRKSSGGLEPYNPDIEMNISYVWYVCIWIYIYLYIGNGAQMAIT